MARKDEILHKIRVAFGNNIYPGDAFLQGAQKDVNRTMRWRHFEAGRTGRAWSRIFWIPMRVL
jgi:hypothetical protein